MDGKMLKRGFTLIELLIVIAIIGIISAVVVVSLSEDTKTATKNIAKSNLAQVQRLFAKEETRRGKVEKDFCTGTQDEIKGVKLIIDSALGAGGAASTGSGSAVTNTNINGYLKSSVTRNSRINQSPSGCLAKENNWVVWLTTEDGETYCAESSDGDITKITLDASTRFGTISTITCAGVD